MPAFVIVTPPAVEPVTLEDIKLYLRVDHDDEDALLNGLIVAAREHAEKITNRVFVTQTWDYHRDNFINAIDLPFGSLQSVVSVKYVDTGGIEQILDPGVYEVDILNEPGKVTLGYQQAWPSIRSVPNAVSIQFIAGYGDATNDVPDTVRLAIRSLVSDYYDSRADSATGMSEAIQRLLAPHKMF